MCMYTGQVVKIRHAKSKKMNIKLGKISQSTVPVYPLATKGTTSAHPVQYAT